VIRVAGAKFTVADPPRVLRWITPPDTELTMPSTRSLGAGASGGGGGLGAELGPELGPELGAEVVGLADDEGFPTLLDVPHPDTDTRATARAATRSRRALRMYADTPCTVDLTCC
jgi:hypothetical protein